MLRRFHRIKNSNICSSLIFFIRLKGTLPVTSGTSEIKEGVKATLKKTSFVNDLFVGKYDFEALTYPEIRETDALKTLSSRVKLVEGFFKQEVDSSLIDSEKHIPETTVEGLRKLGLFGLRAPLTCSGLNLNFTESARLKEIIAQDSSIAELLRAHGDLGLQCVLLAGNSHVDTQYLPDLATGKLLAALCPAGRDVVLATSSSGDRDNWTLNGTSSDVINASSAGVFIVVAQTGTQDELSVFLVDKETEGVTVHPPRHEMGARGCSVSQVSFKNTPVPAWNVLSHVNSGHQFMRDVLATNMYSSGSAGIAILKKLLSLAADFSVNKQYFGKPLHNFGWVQKKLGEVCCRAYAIESLVYLTAGLLDASEVAQCISESAIVKIFTTENVQRSIDECQEIFGHSSYVEEFPFERLLRDTWMFTRCGESNGSLRSSLVVKGLQYSGFTYPMSSQKLLRKVFNKLVHDTEHTVLDLNLHHHVHPTLENTAKQLEYCVKRFQYALEVLLKEHAMDIVNHEERLWQLADLVINIYAMTAVISRSSRSYCIGLRDSDYEVLVAITFCSRALAEVKCIMNSILSDSEDISRSNSLTI